MKNRKLVVVAFLLVSVMLLGVGYAALTDVLTISGQGNFSTSAADNQFKEDVYFSAAVANVSGDTATILSDNNRASFTCNSVALVGDTATFTFTVTNESAHDAVITVKSISIRDIIADGVDTDEDNDGIFDVRTNVGAGVDLPAATGTTVDTYGTATFIVTVELRGVDGVNPTVAVTGIFDIILDVTTTD